VTTAYVLNEIPSDDCKGILKKLYDSTNDSLIIIETGTPRGFGVILEARDFIVKQGGYILAPCTHALDCPLRTKNNRWCHFEKRVARTKLHKDLKQDAVRGYEDEPYSYLIASKVKPESSQKNRLISRIHGEKILSAELCTHEGTIETITRSKRHDDYKTLKKSDRGDLF
jgi:ribosomal protein RSM22 (predicted rRNA methylase)